MRFLICLLLACFSYLKEEARRPLDRGWAKTTHARELLRTAAERVGKRRSRTLNSSLPWNRQAWQLLAQHAQLDVDEYCHRNVLRRAVIGWASAFDCSKLFEHLMEASFLRPGEQGTITVYVSSVDGSDADDGSTWALAKATITGGLAVATDATFNFIYVDSAHSVSTASAITWNAATASSFICMISVNRNGSTTTGDNGVLAGATETCTGNVTTNFGSVGAQYWYMYGVHLSGGASAGNSNGPLIGSANARQEYEFVSCTFSATGTGNSAIQLGNQTAGTSPTVFRVRNCAVNSKSNATATTGAILVRNAECQFSGLTHAYSGATKSTALFAFSFANGGRVWVRDSDLSGFNTTSGGYFDVTGLLAHQQMSNCKLSATPAIVIGTWPGNTGDITNVLSDSGDTHNVFGYYNRLGTITVDTGIYRNNGARFNGEPLSWKIVTNAACNEKEPFVTPWIERKLTATGTLTFDLELIRDSVTDYTDREVWGSISGILESASFPVGTPKSTRNARPHDGTPADLTNSAEVWTETLTNDNEMYVRVTATVAEKSAVRARLNVGVASTTLYLDPVVVIQGQGNNPPTSWSVEGAFNAEPASFLAPAATIIQGIGTY